MTGKYADAAAILEELEKSDPNWIDPHIELAALYYKLHRPEDGQRERDIVQQLEAKEQKQGPSRSSGDLQGAIAFDKQAPEGAPGNADLRTGPGLAYYRSGDLSSARREFEAVHSAHPDDVRAAVLLAFTFNKLGREADTVSLLAPLESGHEADLDLEYALGYAMLVTGRHEEGIARIEKVAAARQAADVWMLAGRARFDLRQFKEALADAREALKANASYPGAHTLAGQALYATNNIDEAVPDFQAALRQSPTDFLANLYLGIIRFDEHDFDNARPLLELALSISPKDPLTRLQVARLRNMEGNTSDALSLLEGLEKSDPDWIDPHIELAALYYKLRRPEDGQRERDTVKRLQDLQQTQGPKRSADAVPR
jgi:tetratricopeptide (TPR) repeat protein